MFTVYAIKDDAGNVHLYRKYPDCSHLCTIPAHYSKKPDRRFRYYTLNCCRVILDWDVPGYLPTDPAWHEEMRLKKHGLYA